VNGVFDPYPIRAVVTDQYKLIHFLNHEIEPPKGNGVGKSPEFELFDLMNDPMESVNLAGDVKYAEIMEDMQKRLELWSLKVGDKGMETEFEAVDMFPEEGNLISYHIRSSGKTASNLMCIRYWPSSHTIQTALLESRRPIPLPNQKRTESSPSSQKQPHFHVSATTTDLIWSPAD
jgi:hypothetical protein